MILKVRDSNDQWVWIDRIDEVAESSQIYYPDPADRDGVTLAEGDADVSWFDWLDEQGFEHGSTRVQVFGSQPDHAEPDNHGNRWFVKVVRYRRSPEVFDPEGPGRWMTMILRDTAAFLCTDSGDTLTRVR